jgi:rare lipoprotein A
MKASNGYIRRGTASWYGTKFHGRRTSSGEPYDMFAMTAAHKTLPLPTYARVTNLRNGRSVVVRINDRGPFHDNRLIDLSYAAAHKLGITATGTAPVEVRAIDPRLPKRPAEIRSLQPTPPAAADPAVYLQVGAFGSLANAERLRHRLERAAIEPVDISLAMQTENVLYRVRVGPLNSAEATGTLLNSLQSLGINNPRIVVD